MSRIARDRQIGIMLVVACVALLGTSRPDYVPDVEARLEQQVVLTGDAATATTTVRITTSAKTIPAGSSSHDSRLRVAAESSFAPGAGAGTDPELSLTVGTRPEGDAERGDELLELRLEDVCIPGEACEAELDVSVEWLNPVPDHQATITVIVEAGVDYSNGLIELARAPSDAAIDLEPADPLTALSDAPSIRRQTDPETIELAVDAPFALRGAWVELDAASLDLPAGSTITADVVISATSAAKIAPQIAVWAHRGEAEPAQAAPGRVVSVECPAGETCRYEYSLVVEWDGRAATDRVDVRWGLAAVLREVEGLSGLPDDALRVGVDRVVTTDGKGRDRVTARASGSISSAPGDPPVDVPVEPGDGPHMAEAFFRTWLPFRGGWDVAVPSGGELRLTARSADGEALAGSVRVGVVAPYRVTGDSYLRDRELTPSSPTMSVALKPSLGCFDVTYLDPEPPDGICSVPFDIFVQPPDAATGEVTVDWEIVLEAIAPDGMTLADEDLRVETVEDR